MRTYSYARRLVLPTLALSGALILAGGPAFAGGGHDKGHGHDKVAVCHMPGEAAEQTLWLPKPAVKAHLKHGDVLGKCVPVKPTPIPEPEPTVEPTPVPEPEPTVEPTPEPEPEPEPTVDPEPTVEPEPTEPQPTTEPQPEPEPEPTIDTSTPTLGPATSFTAPPNVGVRMPDVLAETGTDDAWVWWLVGGLGGVAVGTFLLAHRTRTARRDAETNQ